MRSPRAIARDMVAIVGFGVMIGVALIAAFFMAEQRRWLEASICVLSIPIATYGAVSVALRTLKKIPE